MNLISRMCFVTAVFFLHVDLRQAQAFPQFQLVYTDTAYGNYRETLLPADLDHDGDMDFFSGEGRSRKLWWFQKNGEVWRRHLVSDSNVNDVGAALFDADSNGFLDRVSSSFWYRNPGAFQPDSAGVLKQFEAYRYSDQQYLHDILTADIDQDGRLDIITIEFSGIRWFRAPRADSACGLWEPVMVNTGTSNPQQHGGIAVGDLDGDKDLDISRLDRWFENKDGKGVEWIEHVNIPFGLWDPSAYGLSGRALIVDVNGDGHMDILQTECDLPNGRVAWFENKGGQGAEWSTHLIKDSTDGQDYHSLAYVDFDGDGDSDVFSGGGSHSSGKVKIYVWENLDGKGLEWKEHILSQDITSLHDATSADMDGDGDMDILGKNFLWGVHFVFVNQTKPNHVERNMKRVLGPLRPMHPSKSIHPFNGKLHRSDGRRVHPPHNH
jgi:FG-GAP-like repeat